jgi:alpha-glucosidase
MPNDRHETTRPSRRDFLSSAIGAPVILRALPAFANAGIQSVKVQSPDSRVSFIIARDVPYSGGVLMFRGSHQLNVRFGLTVDGLDLGREIDLSKVERYKIFTTYLSRGVHAQAIDHCNGTRVEVTHRASGTKYTIEARAYNDGIAFRYLVPADNQKSGRVVDELTSFRLYGGYRAWYHDFEGHYEGIHQRKEIDKIMPGEWCAPPLTVELMNGLGYASFTESALVNYPGMGLQAGKDREFKVVLGHALPVSHPFDLRYGKQEAERLSKPAEINGAIVTPWRVIMLGNDLNTLVNCDLVNSLASPPDRSLFPQGLETAWLKPGRAVWRYLDGGENTFEGMKEFSRLAGQLGFEYNVVEGFWQRWPETQMRELVDYSKQFKVGVWFWKHSRDLRNPEARENFFSLLNRVGVVGTKIDFFDHEAKEIIDLYQALLRTSAEHKIMVEFHGANKPAGESRTWPNEMTREAVRGLEYRSMEKRARHNTTLPFTRFLAGHADYTPMHFGERRKETSWAHQIASAVVFTSPLMIYGAHPKNILENPAADLIKTIPSIWDETIVLPPSEIGELAIFARRRRDDWFVGIMNGETARSIRLELSFLGRGTYQAMLVRDQQDDPAAVKIESAGASRKDVLPIEMRVGGGFVARFRGGSAT